MSSVPHPVPHPCKGWLSIHRLTNRQVAKVLGVTEGHVSRVLNGRHPTSPRFRAGLSKMLGKSENDLFLPEDRSRGVTVSHSRKHSEVGERVGDAVKALSP